MVEPLYPYNIIVIGDSGVGKTALEEYFRKVDPTSGDERFSGKKERNLIGMGLNILIIPVKEKRIKLVVLVLSEDRRKEFLLIQFLNSSWGVVLLYDITNASSFDRLSEWFHIIEENSREIPIVLAGNKIDLEEKRVISKEQGVEFQKRYNLSSFMEISIKNGEGVDKIFEHIGELILYDKPSG